MSEPLMVLYAVRNAEGKYLRSKGIDFNGSPKGGKMWVDSLQQAKIYPRPGPARARVTFFANSFPQYGIPELVELHVTEVVVTKETERVQKSQKRKAKAEADRNARWEEYRREEARKKIQEAQAELAMLGG